MQAPPKAPDGPTLGPTLGPTHRAIEAVWREEAARIVAGTMRLVRDLGLAEELAQDALVSALEHWPRDGLPDNPGAWLTTAAKRRALDHLRQRAMQARHHEAIGEDLQALQAHVVPDFVDALDAAHADDIGDDLLRLIFTACHPVLGTEARVALTLRLLGGLETAEIARAYLVPEPTMAQRIVRAKRTLAAARVPFEVPQAAERAQRLGSVLEVIYLIFNEGYAATRGPDWMRPALCEQALRLGRTLAQLIGRTAAAGSPDAAEAADAEVHGLLALMELQASRLPARLDAEGRPVLLMEQDRARWDRELMRRGLAALDHALATSTQAGPYTLQAAIAACHARATDAAATDWPSIVALYGALAQALPSPVVELNRAVAVGMAQGPAAALPLVDALLQEPSMRSYPWLPSVRGDLLRRLGREDEARAEFERAAGLTDNQSDKAVLMARARGAR